VQKALDLDPALPEANALMGAIVGNCDYDWKGAERRFGLALAREPVPPEVRAMHASYYLMPVGRLDEAIREYQRALKQDPLNTRLRQGYAICLTAAANLSGAEREFRQSLEIEPSFPVWRAFLAWVLGHRGELAEALEQAEAAYGHCQLGQ